MCSITQNRCAHDGIFFIIFKIFEYEGKKTRALVLIFPDGWKNL